jgi:ribosomal protein S18 acetylase RimI-like enzyme
MHDLIRGLIRQELARDSRFLDVPLDPYCEKLFQHAEFALSWSRQVCQGFVAYYCNDHATRVAYITMIIVTPEARGTGIGRALVQFVRERARCSGFTYLRLEVGKANTRATAFYKQLGFRQLEERAEKWLMECLV